MDDLDFLDEEDWMDSVEKGEWVVSSTSKEEIIEAQKGAVAYFEKKARVNIRISSHDLLLLKQKAAYKGLPYQAFISSILHEYAAGHFVERS